MKTPKFPKFDSYALVGDTINWEQDGFELTATLEADEHAHVNDADCYSPFKIKQWRNDEWFFVGVVISVACNGVQVEEHATSLWGIECNFNKRSNRYLATVAQELGEEAITSARARAQVIIKALQGVAA